MTERIKVGNVLGETFSFAQARWATILHLGFVPLVIAMLIAIGLTFALLDVQALQGVDTSNGFNFSTVFRFPAALSVLIAGAGIVVIALLFSGFITSVIRLVALGEEPTGMLVIRIDGPTIRVFCAQLIMAVINYAVIVICLLIAMALVGVSFGDISSMFPVIMEMAELSERGGTPSPEMLEPLQKPAAAIVWSFLLMIIPLVFLNVRLAPFIPGSAVQNRLFLVGGYSLSAGRFWTLLATFFVFGLCMFVMMIIYSIFNAILEGFGNLSNLGGVMAIIGMVFTALSFIASLVYQIFVTGIQSALYGVVYRRLQDEKSS